MSINFVIKFINQLKWRYEMKIVTKNYEVYDFEELSEEIKGKVICDNIKFIIECYDYEELSDNIKKGIDKANSMLTPWFIGEYIFEYAKEEIIENCKDYQYTKDGNIFIE